MLLSSRLYHLIREGKKEGEWRHIRAKERKRGRLGVVFQCEIFWFKFEVIFFFFIRISTRLEDFLKERKETDKRKKERKKMYRGKR